MMFSLNSLFTVLLATSVGIASAVPALTMFNVTTRSPFGIDSGTQGNNIVAWVNGDSPCNNVIVAAARTNPCGRQFSLNGQSGLSFEGCGGDGLWIDQNHNFFANCGPVKGSAKCNGPNKNGVSVNWHCF